MADTVVPATLATEPSTVFTPLKTLFNRLCQSEAAKYSERPSVLMPYPWSRLAQSGHLSWISRAMLFTDAAS